MNLKNVCLSILIILGFIFAFIMKKSLSQDQINILNHKGTEPAFSGDLLYNKEKGTYLCVGCDNVLFSSKNKFDSGSGWPSFSETNNIKCAVMVGAVRKRNSNVNVNQHVRYKCQI